MKTTPLINSARVPGGIDSYRSWKAAWSNRWPATSGGAMRAGWGLAVLIADDSHPFEEGHLILPQSKGWESSAMSTASPHPDDSHPFEEGHLILPQSLDTRWQS